jgi:hypothetical protein
MSSPTVHRASRNGQYLGGVDLREDDLRHLRVLLRSQGMTNLHAARLARGSWLWPSWTTLAKTCYG